MRKLVTALCALVFLSSCDDELKLVSRDFSVTLKSIDGNTAVVGKPINCTLTISDLDPDNGDQILTRFEVRDGDGVILVDNNEYSPGETFEYDFKANNRLDFDFIPATEGEAYIVMGVASELVTRSDSIKLKVSSPEINIRFQNVPDLMLVSEEAEFYLQLDTELYGVKASARFVKGSGRVYISGYDATRGEGVALEKNNLVTFRPDATGQAVIEFTVSSRYGLPVKENVTIQVNRKYSINSLVYWVTYVHNVVYSFYRSMIYCYINSTQRCAGSIVIDIIPTNGADKRKFFPFAPYFPVTNVIKRYFYPYFPAIIGIKGYSFPYFPYLSGIMKIKTALYSLFSRLDWHKTVVFPCLGEIYEGIRSLSWEIPVT